MEMVNEKVPSVTVPSVCSACPDCNDIASRLVTIRPVSSFGAQRRNGDAHQDHPRIVGKVEQRPTTVDPT